MWPSIVSWTECIAQGSDYLRLDFFVNTQEYVCVASEMNVFPWPESQFFSGYLQIQQQEYIRGLRDMTTAITSKQSPNLQSGDT